MVKRSAGVFLPVFLSLALILPISRSAAASDYPNISVQNAARGILCIKTYDWKGTLLRSGAGYFSGKDGSIATAVPVIDGGYFVEAVSQNNSEYVIDQINPLSQSTGLIFTRLEENPADFTFIDKVAPFPGKQDEVWVPGIDRAGRRCLVKAVVLEAREIPGTTRHLYIKTSLPLGSAGSPVINEKGEVAGMVLLLAGGESNAGIIVSTDKISSSYGVSGEVVSLLTWTDEKTMSWLDGPGLYLSGVASYYGGNYTSAVVCLEKAVAQKSGIRKVNLVLGDCYREMSEDQKAIDAYEKALQRAKKWSEYHLSLVRLYLKQKRISDVRRIWEETTRYDQKGNKSTIVMAWLLDATGSTSEALVLAKKAVQMNPDCARAQGALGELLSKQGRFEEAFLALEKSILLQSDRNEFTSDLCYAAIRSGRYSKAIRVCDKAVQTSGERALYLMYLGDAYAAGDQDEKAVDSYRLSAREDPGNIGTWCRLGDLLSETGQYREAVEAFQDGLAALPDSTWLHFKLGKTCSLMGDQIAAVREIQILKNSNQALAHQLSLRLMAGTSVPGP